MSYYRVCVPRHLSGRRIDHDLLLDDIQPTPAFWQWVRRAVNDKTPHNDWLDLTSGNLAGEIRIEPNVERNPWTGRITVDLTKDNELEAFIRTDGVINATQREFVFEETQVEEDEETIEPKRKRIRVEEEEEEDEDDDEKAGDEYFNAVRDLEEEKAWRKHYGMEEDD